MAITMPGRVNLPTASQLLRRRSASTAVPRSSAERLWTIAGTLAAAALVLIGYFLVIAPQRATTSDVQAQVATAQAQQESLQSRIQALRSDYRNLARYEAQLAAAKQALPSDAGISDFVRELHTIGAQTSTTLANVTVGTPAAVAAPTPAATTAPAAVPASTGLYSISISAAVAGSPGRLNAFLQQLQEVQPRAVLVTHVTETNGADAGGTLTLSMVAFMAPGAGS